jgi:hypothetical protein
MASPTFAAEPRPNRRMSRSESVFLDGFLAAMTEVATVIGKQPIDGMSDREWQLICAIQEHLAVMAANYARKQGPNY